MTIAAPPRTMQALALVAPRTLELRELSVPEPGPHDVLVEVTHVGLCGTDWHIWSGEANYHRDSSGAPVSLEREPQVLGHEVAGIVVACGAEVGDLAPGDAVVLDQGLNCHSQRMDGICEYCETGASHQCMHYREHGITGLQGGLAGYLALPAVNAVKVRACFDLGLAVLSEPLACVLHACDALESAPARWQLDGRGSSGAVDVALVVGGGPAGLLFVQVLREVLGYEGRLLLADPNPAKRALAESFGAEAVEDPAAALGPARAQLVVDASGSGALFEALPGLMRKQATVVLYGHGHGGVGMEALNAVQFLEPALLSPVGASGGFDRCGRPTVYQRALRLLETGTVQAAPLVTHRFAGLQAAAAAFDGEARGADYVKGIVEVGSAA